MNNATVVETAMQKRLKAFKQQCNEHYEATVDPVDLHDMNDPQTCAEYASEIFQWLRATESIPGNNNTVSPTYMSRQEDINEKMRAILIDWLVEVHLKFKLVPESLYLTVNLIDRYLEKEQVNRQKLQLAGVTAMLIACKYEEIYAPEVRDFVYITDKAYTREEILQMEFHILSTLDFSISSPSSYRFLERFGKIANANSKQLCLARYLIELPLIEYRMLKHCPSN
jgi:cyclin B